MRKEDLLPGVCVRRELVDDPAKLAANLFVVKTMFGSSFGGDDRYNGDVGACVSILRLVPTQPRVGESCLRVLQDLEVFISCLLLKVDLGHRDIVRGEIGYDIVDRWLGTWVATCGCGRALIARKSLKRGDDSNVADCGPLLDFIETFETFVYLCTAFSVATSQSRASFLSLPRGLSEYPAYSSSV